MGYSTKRPYRLFKREAEHQAWLNRPRVTAADVQQRMENMIRAAVINRACDLPAEDSPEYEKAVEAALLTAEERAIARLGAVGV